ncbi:uncharacterized protein B0H18DRAFT_976920 [Fomitopsis serialis]|uniref:uncharacterized protein n=1 Tax=Fomitopsis serialis TaxID=139415 RepID=UPI0020082A00|nr:uncharacterized protein B0H18DRAFT_976920 [Neoantrodia serialis]KAH9935702.1 hypothetical protein B0H18DRAFT_976920 [Neoantrodia serialis]
MVSALSLDGDYEDPIEIDETFTENSRFPGTVKIIVESTTFWAHKEVLYFASSFFQAALSGAWAETGRPQSTVSSVITISQPPTVPGRQSNIEDSPDMTFAPPDPDVDIEDLDLDGEPEIDPSPGDKAKAREDSLSKLENSGTSPSSPRPPEGEKGKEKAIGLKEKRRRKDKKPDAIIILKEEKASTFHDFLKFVYPHLVCTITWNNVEGLMNISHKLHVSSLERECLTFLVTHAAGRPIKAMRIAELFGEEELYRESSRFVLDNPGGWGEEELRTLSQETLLKLEKRRTWFLERVLKLGLVQVAKEYQCCATCPDPSTCARLLEEKWRQAYQAVFRFGPCQPSMGVSPPLSLTHLSCQTTAKAFIATLFDRMFSLGLRAGASTGPRRHFLFCTLNDHNTHRSKRSRDLLS